MTAKLFKTLIVVTPWLACTILPSIIFGTLLGQWGTNLIWGHIFGFGWFIAQSYYGAEHYQIAEAIGLLVWPPLILITLFWISGAIWRAEDTRWRRRALLMIALSCLPMVPAKTILPVYTGGGVPADFNVLLTSD